MTQFKAIIIGASGYTAVELIRICLTHPNIKIIALVGNSAAGKEVSEIYTHLQFADLPLIQNITEIDFDEADIVFSCLPHGELQKFIRLIPADKKVIDVAADFRLQDLELYKEYYGDDHEAPELISESCYGLPELFREDFVKHSIIGCPGCYPTSILLPLFPLVKQNLLTSNEIIIDSKTGVSGAGRKLSLPNLFAEMNENAFAYSVSKHRHLAEIIETLAKASEQKFSLQFTPQIIPVTRGIISTIYVKSASSASELKGALEKFYRNENFVRIYADNLSPNLKTVVGTNYCDINIFDSANSDFKIIVSCIDNLTKGSSGQAVQNFNILFGLPENTGLNFQTLYP